jgi:hypothetical protein
MWYFKAPGRVIRLSPSGKFYQSHDATEWGRITQYKEVADDQFAVRQVDVYENGNMLRYDRSHREDEYGSLIGLRFSRKPKWSDFFPGAEIISADEFEKVWQASSRDLQLTRR